MTDGTPRPSSTVVLLDERNGQLTVLLVRRHAATAFGDVWAFPGGVLEPGDGEVDAAISGRAVSAAARRYLSAAVRELFEETGVLLASCSGRPAGLDAARRALNDGSSGWADIVHEYGIEIRADDLHWFSHWITPEGLGKRFTTRFYLASMPAGQTAEHCGRELIDSRWCPIGEAIAQHERGDLPMIFPTISSLRALAGFTTAEAAFAEAARREHRGIEPILPVAVDVGGARRIVLPGDPLYPTTTTPV